MDIPKNEDKTLEAMADEAARLIRYRFLPELVGTKLIVQSEESMAADVRNAFGQFIDESRLEASVLHAWPAYHRYGCTHFELPARDAMLQGAKSGMEVLFELGFVEQDGQPPCLGMLDGDEFLESLRKNQPCFLLFLKDEAPIAGPLPNQAPPGTPGRNPFSPTTRYRPHFPVTFLVTDACLGNTDWLWRNRHFYW